MQVNERFFEDYEVGERRVTQGRTITEADIVIHAGQTGDFFPHHMDTEFAKATEFGRRIAHGTLVLSVGVGMTATDINPRSVSYGYDRVRFIRPVFIGDTIRARAVITGRSDHPRRTTHGFVTERVEVINQHDEVVLACDHLYLTERSHPTTTAPEPLDG